MTNGRHEPSPARRPMALSRPELRAESDADQITARVIWYYYVGSLTQQEIADRLGLTRLRVNRIIGQARADGSVRIDVRLPLLDCAALAAQLIGKFGLADAVVVPSLRDAGESRRVIGEETGLLVDRVLREGQSLGIGWGRTLRASLARLPHRAAGAQSAQQSDGRASAGVVGLMGGLTRGSGINTFEVSTQFADALGAECWYLAAPLYCPTEEIRHALLTHAGLADVMRRAREVQVALMTCGDLSDASLIASLDMVKSQRHELLAMGAVGDLLGHFIGGGGELVDHPLNRQVFALSPTELSRVPVSILASGGLNKVPIIRAALSARYVNHLVTDEACAHALLE